MTTITNPHAASSTSPPMGDLLASAAHPPLRSLVALVGLHVAASSRRYPICDAPRLGAAPRTSTALQPLESP